jgi:uncharacterized protein (DUF697 family)
MSRSKLGPLSLISLVRELRTGAGDRRPIAVAGASQLVPLLARELRAGGEASAVVEGATEHDASTFAALVWLGPPDERTLRAASLADVPIVAVSDEPQLPYVLAADIVAPLPGHGLPVDAVAAALARRLGEGGTALAARLPVLREPLCRHLIAVFSRRNALVAAAVFIPGVDLPVLTLNQARLVLRLALAHGLELDAKRARELLAVVGAGYGLRAVAREALDFIPVVGWAVKGAVAYGGTRGVGEAALRYFASIA